MITSLIAKALSPRLLHFIAVEALDAVADLLVRAAQIAEQTKNPIDDLAVKEVADFVDGLKGLLNETS